MNHDRQRGLRKGIYVHDIDSFGGGFVEANHFETRNRSNFLG